MKSNCFEISTFPSLNKLTSEIKKTPDSGSTFLLLEIFFPTRLKNFVTFIISIISSCKNKLLIDLSIYETIYCISFTYLSIYPYQI